MCPSIWLIELDKLDTRLAKKESLESQSSEFPSDETTTAVVPSSVASADPTEGNFSTKVDLGVLKDFGVRMRF